MNVLGLIPARSGSKGIPRKNIAELAGRPLLAYTCEAALNCGRLSRVVLSTDDEEIAQVGRDLGVEVPFLRPPELALDNTPSFAVADHAVDFLIKTDWKPDVLVLLQPTSPLREPRHIEEALLLMERSNADTVVSVVEVPHPFSPYSVMRLEDAWLQDFWPEPTTFDRYNRQNVPVLFARNGPAILATRVEGMLNRQSLYGSKVAAYVMREEESVDIDEPFHLELAEFLLGRRKASLRSV